MRLIKSDYQSWISLVSKYGVSLTEKDLQLF